jgi:hypothetical protein
LNYGQIRSSRQEETVGANYSKRKIGLREFFVNNSPNLGFDELEGWIA